MMKRLVVAIFLFALAMCSSAYAQTSAPRFLITWKVAGSYLPSFYPDKAIPTYGSVITASVLLLSPQGNLINLGSQTIYWYLNGTLIGGGQGVQSVSFLPLNEPPTINTLEVDIPNYNGAYLIHSAPIQTTRPVVIIEAPYPSSKVAVNSIAVTALPYFFNTTSPSNLSYSWTVNGRAGANTENPQIADILLPASTTPGTALNVSLTTTNPRDSTIASASVNLTYAAQL